MACSPPSSSFPLPKSSFSIILKALAPPCAFVKSRLEIVSAAFFKSLSFCSASASILLKRSLVAWADRTAKDSAKAITLSSSSFPESLSIAFSTLSINALLLVVAKVTCFMAMDNSCSAFLDFSDPSKVDIPALSIALPSMPMPSLPTLDSLLKSPMT